MNYLNTTAIAVFGFVFAGSMNTTNAAEVNVNLDDNVNNPSAHIQIQGTDKAAYNLDNIEGSNIKQDGQIYNLQGDIERANTAINKAQDTANTAQDGVNANTQALAGKVDKSIFDADQDRQDHALQHASDKATQAFNTGAYAQSLAVDAQTVAAANKAAVANVQSRQQAQETTIQNHSAQLANHESRITALESQNNAKFSSLENQQNEDRKEYRAGIAGAASLAGLHYVDTDNAVAVGAANFKDAQGYAVGYRHKFAENIAATLSTSGTSNGDEIVAASASYGW
ncbi:TPA: YadA C-terminal domain-containing protein [Enterobacter roggenkampii]|nr:YadA C-terminal domain-containing protein [Enterobacter roggenkampii]